MRGVSWVAEEHLASQNGLCSIELDSLSHKAQNLLYCTNTLETKRATFCHRAFVSAAYFNTEKVIAFISSIIGLVFVIENLR